jgi:hypothetical protein
MKNLQKIIEDKLKGTIKGCSFKKAFLPKDWACVKIKTFAKELAMEINRR